MEELFSQEGEALIDPNGKWIDRAGAQVYHWYCCSKEHFHVDPDIADQCCKKNKVDSRPLDDNWLEVSIFQEVS